MSTFTQADIEAALARLGIDASSHGHVAGPKRFCSLRAPENDGIYFLSGIVELPAGVARSIVVTDRARDDLVAKGHAIIVVEHSQLAYYQLMDACFPEKVQPGIHATAIVAADAEVDPGASIGPYCVIGRARLGANVVLASHVVVHDNSVLEGGVVIESHTTIGATGVAWVWHPQTGERVRQPQIGGVRVGAGTFIGSDVSIVRGSINEYTTLGRDCMIAHGSKIGHSCWIGDHTHFANNVTVAGNVDIGSRCFLGSGCVIRPRTSIAEGTVVGAGAVVVKSITVPNMTLTGVPAKPSETKEAPSGIPRPMSRKKENPP